MDHPMRIELSNNGLPASLINRHTMRDAQWQNIVAAWIHFENKCNSNSAGYIKQVLQETLEWKILFFQTANIYFSTWSLSL